MSRILGLFAELGDKVSWWGHFKGFLQRYPGITYDNWNDNKIIIDVFKRFRADNPYTSFTDLEMYSQYVNFFEEKFNIKPDDVWKHIHYKHRSDYSDDDDDEYDEEEMVAEKGFQEYCPEVDLLIEKYKKAYEDCWFDKTVQWFTYNLQKLEYVEEFFENTKLDEIDNSVTSDSNEYVCIKRKERWLNLKFFYFLRDNIKLVTKELLKKLEQEKPMWMVYYGRLEDLYYKANSEEKKIGPLGFEITIITDHD